MARTQRPIHWCRGLMPGMIIMLVGCGAAAPPWYGEHGEACRRMGADGARGFCMEAEGMDRADATRKAVTGALGQAATEIQTTAQSKMRIETQCIEVSSNGQSIGGCEERLGSVVSAESARLSFRNIRLSKSHVMPTEAGKRTWVRVSIPADEWARLVRKAMGKSLLWLQCEVEGVDGCPPTVVDAVKSALPNCQVKPAGEWLVGPVADLKTVQSQALSMNAADVFRIRLRSEVEREGDELIQAAATGSWDIIDAVDGRTLMSKNLPKRVMKGYDRRQAVMGAFKSLPDFLTTESCGLSDGAGSVCCALKNR